MTKRRPKKKEQRQRAGKQEKAQRVQCAVQLLGVGATRQQVLEALIKQFGISRRQAERYSVDAQNQLKALTNLEASQETLGAILSQLQNYLFKLNAQSNPLENMELILKVMSEQMKAVALSTKVNPIGGNPHEPNQAPKHELSFAVANLMEEINQEQSAAHSE